MSICCVCNSFLEEYYYILTVKRDNSTIHLYFDLRCFDSIPDLDIFLFDLLKTKFQKIKLRISLNGLTYTLIKHNEAFTDINGKIVKNFRKY